VSTAQRFGSGGPWEDAFGYARAVLAGDFLLVSGCTSTVDGQVRHPGDAAGQARVALRTALDAVERAGGSRTDVVRTRMYVTDIARDGSAVGMVHGEFFADVRPAATMVEVAGLLDPLMVVEIEVDAYLGVAR
jgi:enamine deaminase RidA (YjgF/YER057c/UK114 family)